jgi:hypothetical protein
MDNNELYVKISKELLDELESPACSFGSKVLDLFTMARRHRDAVDCRNRRAFYSSQSKYPPEFQCKLGDVDVFMGIFARLRATFLAWHFDRVEAAGEKLFTVNPTPVPSVPDSLREFAVSKVLDDLMNSGLPPELAPQYAQEKMKEVKANVLNFLYKEAKKATDKASTVMLDKLVEGDFLAQYMTWWANFATYSHSVMQFPCVEMEERLVWAGNKLKPKQKAVLKARAISPFDFWVTPDSTNAQDGKAAFVRARLNYDAVLQLKRKAKGAVIKNLDYLLNEGKPKASGNWIGAINENEAKLLSNTYTHEHIEGTWDVIKCFTKMTGTELKEYGVTEFYKPSKVTVEDLDMYEIEAWMIDGRIAYLVPSAHPTNERPLHMASWEMIQGSAYGKGLYDIVEGYERAACLAGRDIVKNAAISAGFIAEQDSSRFDEGAEPQTIRPWSLYRTTEPMVGASQKAIHFHTIPSQVPQLTSLHDWYSQQAQEEAGIFDMMAGSPTEISSALRTNMGMNTVQGNGNKLINYRSIVADRFCFKPLFKSLWVYLMQYEEDDSIKVDADVDIKGLVSVTTKNAQEARAIELLQYLPAFLQAANGTGVPIDPKFIMSVLKTAAGQLGGATEYLSDPEEQDSIQKAVGSNAPINPTPALDGRSNVPAPPEAASRLPA